MRLVALLGSAVVAGMAFGCGGSGGGNLTASGGTPPPTTPISGISIVEYSFSPAPDTVKLGTRVTWTNDGTVAHTATDDGGTWDSGQLSSSGGGGAYGGGSTGGTYTRTFSTAGTFTYHCANHPTLMKGTIVVTP